MNKARLVSLLAFVFFSACNDQASGPDDPQPNEDLIGSCEKKVLQPECPECDRFDYAAACIALLEEKEALERTCLESCLLISPLYDEAEVATKLDLFEERGLIQFSNDSGHE